MSEHECVSPGQSTMIRMAGVSLVAAAAVSLAIAGSVWPGGVVGEGGHKAAPSSLTGVPGEAEHVEAAMRAVRDAIVAALIALGGLGCGAGGLILVVSGEAGLSARICLKASVLAMLLALLAAPILQIRGGPAMGPTVPASASESATVHPARTYPGESQ